jgi:hypothetical protein
MENNLNCDWAADDNNMGGASSRHAKKKRATSNILFEIGFTIIPWLQINLKEILHVWRSEDEDT